MSDVPHNLFQRKDTKRWILAYVPPGRTWQNPLQITAPKEIRAKAQAKAWTVGKLAEIRAAGGVLATTRRGAETLRQVHEHLMKPRENHPDVKPATTKNQRSHLNAQILVKREPKNDAELEEFARADIADVAMADVDIARARAFVRMIRARNSPYHTRNIVSTARAMWESATAERLPGETRTILPASHANPFKHDVVIDELPEGQSLDQLDGELDPATIPMAAAQMLIDASDLVELEWRVRYTGAITEGLDDGELAGLWWEDVLGLEIAIDDPQVTPYLKVRRALALRGPDGFASVSTPKTSNRLRDVPLHPAFHAALIAWKIGWEQLVCRKPRPRDFVFVREDGKPWRPMSYAIIRNDLRALNVRELRAGRAAPLDDAQIDRLDFKAARRTFSSALKTANVEEEDRGKLMGHRGKSVTTHNYTAFELRRLASFVARIPLCWSVQNPVRTGGGPRTDGGSEAGSNSADDVRLVPEARMGFEPTYDGFAKGQRPMSQADNLRPDATKTGVSMATTVGKEPHDGQAPQRAEGAAQGNPVRGPAKTRVPRGLVGVRLEDERGRTIARTDVAPGELAADVEERLAVAVRQRSGR